MELVKFNLIFTIQFFVFEQNLHYYFQFPFIIIFLTIIFPILITLIIIIILHFNLH
jgi:hypothetical protein